MGNSCFAFMGSGQSKVVPLAPVVAQPAPAPAPAPAPPAPAAVAPPPPAPVVDSEEMKIIKSVLRKKAEHEHAAAQVARALIRKMNLLQHLPTDEMKKDAIAQMEVSSEERALAKLLDSVHKDIKENFCSFDVERIRYDLLKEDFEISRLYRNDDFSKINKPNDFTLASFAYHTKTLLSLWKMFAEAKKDETAMTAPAPNEPPAVAPSAPPPSYE